MASTELASIRGYHNVEKGEARELLQPYLQTDGYYLLRPSSDAKGGVLCTICVTNKSKLVNYRLIGDGAGYHIYSNAIFPTIRQLLTHYKTTPINAAVNTRLLNPVLPSRKQESPPEDTYVIMEKGTAPAEEAPANQNQDVGTIPGLHLYLPKGEINTVMSQYLATDGYYLVRPSASSEGQLTLAVSNGGKVLNFKISSSNNEFFISPKRKFPSVPALLETYRTSPIRSKKSGPAKILLLHPIPVDPILEEKHKQLLEDKVARKANEPRSPTPSEAPLPSPWQQHMDQQYKKPYYYNPVTKESTWVRPKPAKPEPSLSSSLTLPPRENGHAHIGSRSPSVGGRKIMKDRPLPTVPGGMEGRKSPQPARNDVTTGQRPPPKLPGRTEHAQNDKMRNATMPPGTRPNMAIPPLPPKEGNPAPSELPRLPPKEATQSPRHQSAGRRPPMPIPGNPAPHSKPDRRSMPPLPPKEDDTPALPPGKNVPPLPPKIDTPSATPSNGPALPKRDTGTRKERKRIVEYEDHVVPSGHTPKQARAPPLPDKSSSPLPSGASAPLPSRNAPPPLPPGRGEAPPLPPGRGEAPPLPPGRGEAPPLPPGRSEAPPLPPGRGEAPPLPPGRGEAPSLPPGRGEAPTGRSHASPFLTKSEASPVRTPPPLPTKDKAPPSSTHAPPLPTKSEAPPTPPAIVETTPNGALSPVAGIPTPPPVGGGAPPPPPPVGGSTPAPPPPPPVGAPAPPPPPPMAPPPSPNPQRASRSGSAPTVTSPPPQADTGSGRPFCANDLQAARTLLRQRTKTTTEEDSGPEPSGIAGVFANAIDTRMNSIRRAVVSDSDESEFEDVDDEDWDD